MKKNRSVQKVFSVLLCCIMCMAIFCQAVFAAVYDDEAGALETILMLESMEDSVGIDKELQIALNQKGLFNCEIELIDKRFLENIINADIDDVSVVTEYVSYCMDVNGQVEEKTMDKSEIDDFFEASFDSITAMSGDDAVMKKTIVATVVTRNGKKKLSCSYMCRWLTDPSERMVDVATIGWGSGQGSFDYSDDYSAYYTCILDTDQYSPTDNANNDWVHTTTSEGYQLDLSSGMRKGAAETGLSCKAELYEDFRESVGRNVYYYTYRNHAFSMNFYLTNLNGNYTYFCGEYFHQKKQGTFSVNGVSASFNLLTGKASLTISGGLSWSTYYEEIGSNALLNKTY